MACFKILDEAEIWIEYRVQGSMRTKAVPSCSYQIMLTPAKFILSGLRGCLLTTHSLCMYTIISDPRGILNTFSPVMAVGRSYKLGEAECVVFTFNKLITSPPTNTHTGTS
jgi:hypothetical protein